MSALARICESVEAHARFVREQIRRAREDSKFRAALLKRWRAIRASIATVQTPTGIELPTLALPTSNDPGEIARYLFGEGFPGEFPFVNSIYREMYLPGSGGRMPEEPTRLFAGLGLAEDTNERFHYLTQHQRSIRLSTAFDGPTLYGMDSDADGVFGKIGEGGVAIDTVEDMERLYDRFALGDERLSVSMTINGPAPIILAMYVAAAQRRFGGKVIRKLRGTVQADILKEVQAQNEIIFPLEASLRFLADMVAHTTEHLPRWYPISISGYHIGEAGATPVQQAAYTLSNGFTYVELFRGRGLAVDRFGPRLSFFLDCGLDVEYVALARVCRKLWAIGMRDVFGAGEAAQRLKLHTQTSGRSLIALGFKNNLTRTAIELFLAYLNATNSCHSNSADEPFTTPGEEYVRLAAHAQSILLEETGLFRHMMNLFTGSPGMRILEETLEKAILEEFRTIDRLGGVLAATEQRYQRSQIQEAAHLYEQQTGDGTRPIIGLNRYPASTESFVEPKVVRTPRSRKQLQVDRLRKFKHRHRHQSARALDELAGVVESGGNVFAELLKTVECCSLGQITGRLFEVVGRFRPSV
ncbi:methylmalonyl-CoA mutase, large subunit [Chthoniobacter flavus Ellin428]|uniref:Methylmalonyl-CoA mutase, large subunit n=1 Tax=Chthoniobacter flavus Ellin428 TaxID=497964 RepID=B4DCE9_9BACT|nr:methylmalonyl-CoA mutase family protein [Chthoniobacter flavus]EDY15898.1 methylmalonyl-CoA mutase, large subunit [Chthoniobacter flavus Ellin428]TCO87398.1 methylmalonyl-CoA mutase cobalamin-binding domain/chain [Chthoniobacter flavus]